MRFWLLVLCAGAGLHGLLQLFGWPVGLATQSAMRALIGGITGAGIAGLLGVALAFAVEPFAARKFLWVLPVAVCLLPALAGLAAVAAAVLMLLVLCAGCLARADRHDTAWNFAGGLAGGLAVCLAPAALPLVSLGLGLAWLRWLLAPAGAGLMACGAGLFDALCFVFALHKPPGGYGVVTADRLSIVYVLFGLVWLLIGGLAWRLPVTMTAGRRRAVGVAATVLLLPGWAVLFRAPLSRALAGLHPDFDIAALWPGVAALILAVALCARRAPAPGQCYGLAALAAVCALGFCVPDLAPALAAAGAVMAVLALQNFRRTEALLF
jgi:hypothetical protein